MIQLMSQAGQVHFKQIMGNIIFSFEQICMEKLPHATFFKNKTVETQKSGA